MKFGRNFGIQEALWSVVTVVFLSVLFFSLFHISSNMGMSMGMTDCPFMTHGEVICPMNFSDHVAAWKSTFLATAPVVILMLALAGLAVVIASVAPNILSKPRYLLSGRCMYSRERIYTFSQRPLQELFSSGILHPKLF